ncbi:hypothetical protein L5B97_00100 [Avibacterium sp. 20-15]|uniref:hypothetical protein n=1 Tax=unclassified Avibacterium TaxID=2685287 RepID=UPI0020263FC7|nr:MULTISPECIES: hypothetical protein [unclassified Avibacterium]MCW9731902.1 hypothetical protein [Avibacterium sp. 20-15]URL04091.1 hypothetical protein L4F93_11180 [Avibacterium sp. 20-132]
MKKLLLFILASVVLLSGCGSSSKNIKAEKGESYFSSKSKDALKRCMIEQLDEFRPYRMVINDFDNVSEIYIGAVQSGYLRYFYLFEITNGKILFKRNGVYYAPLSVNEAKNKIFNCQ